MFRTIAMPAALALSLLASVGTAQQADTGSASQDSPADSEEMSSAAPVSPAAGNGGDVADGDQGLGARGNTLPMSPANAFVSYFDARYVNDNQGEVDGADIAAGSITNDALANFSVNGAKIQIGSLTGAHIQDSALTGSDIADGSIGANDLGIQSITNAKIAINAVTGLSVADASLTGADIADSSITAADLASSSVGASEIATNAVGSSEVADNSLTANDLASSAVGYSEIQFDCITTALLDPAAQNWALNAGSYSNVDLRIQAVEQDSFSHGLYVEFATDYVGDYVISASKSNGDHEFRVDANGNVFADGTFSGGGAFASLIETTEDEREHLRGDVLAIDPSNPRAVRLARGARSTLVAGVYGEKIGMLSTHREFDRPIEADPNGVAYQTDGGALQNAQALSMRDMYDFYSEIPAVTSGIVEVRVSAENGAILPGDLLVTAWTPGHAMRDADPKVGTVLGKALGSLQSGTGLIEVLITLD